MKRISSGTVTVFVLAIVVGLVAAFVVKQAMQPKPQAAAPAPQAPKEPTVQIVVAAKNLVENQVVQADDVRVIRIPAKRNVEGSIRLAAIAENRIVKESVKAGQPILDSHLYGIGETLPGLTSRIPPGMRALPIHVDEQSTIAKMVNIGSRVDIALTVQGSHPDIGELATKTLLHNVEVIAVENGSGNNNRRTGQSGPATITVAVTPADANMLINAEGTGTLNLTLCGIAEGEAQPVSVGHPDHKITRRDLLGLSPLPPAPKPFIIEKWEGGGVKLIKISPDQVEEAQRATANSKKFNAEKSIPVNTDTTGVVLPTGSTASVAIEEIVPN